MTPAPVRRNRIAVFLEMIKFEHTVFALPFAYLGIVLALRGWDWRVAAWVTAAMVSARTAGMCLNRLVDRHIDARNPRTAGRAIVTGEIKPGFAWAVAAASLAALVVSAAALNPLCLALSPVAVALLCVYHYLKRVTPLCHFGVGAVLACAPAGGWAAATGSLDTADPWLLSAAVLFWVAGFDIFYGMQDTEFDRAEGLHSIPARFGEPAAIGAARACHAATLALLGALGFSAGLDRVYWAGLAFATAILAAEHVLMGRDVRRHIDTAFLKLNGLLSTGFFVTTAWAAIR